MKSLGRNTPKLLLVLLFSYGCATVPPPEPEEIRTSALGEDTLPQTWMGGEATSAEILNGWLATFEDPQLDALVAEALANNPDLRVAASRLDQAAAYVGVARAALYPQVGVAGQGSLKLGADLTSGLNGLVLGASWELDLWGRVRYERNAALESLAAIQSDYHWARHSLAAATANSWFLATETLLQKRAAAEMVEDAGNLLELAKTRARVGAGDERDVAAAEASISAYEDNLLKLSLAHENTLRALEVLLGRYPGADLEPRTDLPAFPGQVPAGIPLNVLERRPDLFASERRVAEVFNRVGEAKAARLPRISLTASGGVVDSNVLELAPDFTNPFAGLGAGLIAPLFLGGQLKAQVEIRNAEQRQAIDEYAGLALRALYEVESGLAAEANLRLREQVLKSNVAQNERALLLEKVAFRVGTSDMRRVLGQQLALNVARMGFIHLQSSRLTQRVNLHLALGGSFEVIEEESETLAGEED